MNTLDLKPGGVHFLEVTHDGWCPTLTTGSGTDFQCSPSLRLHQDTDYFIGSETLNRRQRRKAQREAERALRRARRRAP